MRRIVGWFALVAGLLAGAVFLFRTPDTDPVAMRAKYGGPPSQFVDLGGGLKVHLRDTGPRDAPVLMLVHGSNADLHTWDAWAKLLDGRYRVIRFDLPGHGLTGPNPSGDYSGGAFVDVVERVRAKMGAAHMTLAGNSMGGGVAWRYALAHPDRVDRLILVDAAGQPPAGPHTPPLAFRVAQTPGLRDLAAIITPRDLIAKTMPDAFYNRALATDAQIDRYWEMLRYPGNRQATITRFNTPNEPASPAQLHTLRMPVLILWGADDKLIPASAGAWFHEQIPGSRLTVYPQTGHIPMEERADKSAADVDAFIGAH